LSGFTLQTGKKERVYLSCEDDSDWTLIVREIPSETTIHSGHGEIVNSLWEECIKVDIPPSLILDLADLFGWQIDFATDLRKGDEFRIFYELETLLPDGEVIPGNILAARFVNEGKPFTAVAMNVPGAGLQHFDEKGQSVRRTFLKSPLRYRYISSGFSKSRYHPILKRYRPHLGIDYAAPSGTKVSTIGDGTVIYRGRKGGYGNYIQVKHKNEYISCYGHLSRYKKGLRKGSKVKPGAGIGYVGSTGLSTGPHLDFRVKHRGQFINPLTMKSPPSNLVPEALQSEFQTICKTWIEKLMSL